MFSKPKPEETAAAAPGDAARSRLAPPPQATFDAKPAPAPAAPPKPKPAPSVLSSDLTILGNVRSSGDIQVEGTVEGDIRAQMLIVGETATVKGEVDRRRGRGARPRRRSRCAASRSA